MSIRTRLGKLEKTKHGESAEVFIDVLIYEAPPSGGEDEEIVTAHVMWGLGNVVGFKREEGESTDQFAGRMEKVSQMSWPEANKRYKRVHEQ